VYYPVDKRVLAKFPRLAAVSGEIKRTLIRAGAEEQNIDVVLNAIDPATFIATPRRSPRRGRGSAWGRQTSCWVPSAGWSRRSDSTCSSRRSGVAQTAA
jgi:hypothetical protein